MSDQSIPIARAIPVDSGAAPGGIAPHVAGPIGARPKAPKPDRPSGLTALAFVNFSFSAFLFLLILISMVVLANTSPRDDENGAGTSHSRSIELDYPEIVITEAGIDAVGAILLVLAGIGFLKQTRILGRFVGTAYAIISIGGAATILAITPEGYGNAFELSAIISFNYPLLVLALIHTAYRRDLVH